MSLNAVIISNRGRAGVAITAIVIIIAFYLNNLFQVEAEGSLARTLYARDAESMRYIGIVICAMLLTAALGIMYFTWRSCNENIGIRHGQYVQISEKWLQYSYKLLGPYASTTKILVFIPLRNSKLSYDERLGLINIRGRIFVATCFKQDVEWPRSLEEMQEIESFLIPNCFKPDLYQTVSRNLNEFSR
jgi:hypothetical protein